MGEIEEPKYVCTKCGACCRGFNADTGVILFPGDVSRIAHRLNVKTDDFVARYCVPFDLEQNLTKVQLFRLKDRGGECIFLMGNICSIYEDRPTQCERLPFRFFWDGLVDSRYECLKDVSIPDRWSSEPFDRELLSQVFWDPDA